MIQDTSLEAFFKLTGADTKRGKVLQVLRLLPDATNAELAARLGWTINRVTPRINELRQPKYGALVLDAGRRRCRITGAAAHAWKAKYPVVPDPFKQKPTKPKPVETNQPLFTAA